MFSFIISSCVRNIIHLNQLERCLSSIRKYHENKIFIINDSDVEYENSIYTLINKYNNIHVINTILKGSADQQCFKFIIEDIDTNERYIIIQDSMLINSYLDNIEKINDIQFLWHFTNHITDWDIINEPITQYNTEHNIITHTDLLKNHLVKNYYKNEIFQKYALNCLIDKTTWCGCFGNCCIINKQFLIKMNNEVNFVDLFVNNTSNRDRRMNESIFALICHFYSPNVVFSNSYDGLYYDGYNVNIHSGQETYFDELKWCCINKYISKISFDR